METGKTPPIDDQKQRRSEANRRYYEANKKRAKKYYRKNKAQRLAYDRLYRELNRDAYLIGQKLYNDTKRKGS